MNYKEMVMEVGGLTKDQNGLQTKQIYLTLDGENHYLLQGATLKDRYYNGSVVIVLEAGNGQPKLENSLKPRLNRRNRAKVNTQGI